LLRFRIGVEIVDVGHGACWAEYFVGYLLLVERFGDINLTVCIRRAFLGTEDTVEP